MRLNFLLALLIFIAEKAGAQLYAGFTVDVGNRVNDSPPAPNGLLKKTVMPSASVTLYMASEIKNSWFLQYGVSVGSLGYNVKVLPYDSTSTNHYGTYQAFPSYGTFYVSGNLRVGKQISFGRRYVGLFVGGGLTIYRDWSEEGKLGKSPSEILFEYEMHRANDQPKGFAEIEVQTDLGTRLVVGLRYRHHPNAALEGKYLFNQYGSRGQLSLAQRAISVVLILRVTSN